MHELVLRDSSSTALWACNISLRSDQIRKKLFSLDKARKLLVSHWYIDKTYCVVSLFLILKPSLFFCILKFS
jgi:maltodextrin utilization protein YvdJ